MTAGSAGGGPRKPRSRSRLRAFFDLLSVAVAQLRFKGSGDYWEARYRLRGTSGDGSYGESARFKADFVNEFVERHGVKSVVEFGCGDGAQLEVLVLPEYLGVDVSSAAVDICRRRFAGDSRKRFVALPDYLPGRFDVAMSLDVAYHLVEEDVFEDYMHRLFNAAGQHVLIYSTDFDGSDVQTARHVRHRDISGYCARTFPAFTKVSESEAFPAGVADGPRFLVYKRVVGEQDSPA